MKRRADVFRKMCVRTPRSHIVGELKKIRIDDSGELLKSAVNRQPRLPPRDLLERFLLPCVHISFFIEWQKITPYVSS